jgi:hypothetical protein
MRAYECDPFAGAGCPAGDGCYAFIEYPTARCGSETYRAQCFAAGTTGQGRFCQSGSECAPGSGCFITGAMNRCLRLCRLDGSGDPCPRAARCVSPPTCPTSERVSEPPGGLGAASSGVRGAHGAQPARRGPAAGAVRDRRGVRRRALVHGRGGVPRGAVLPGAPVVCLTGGDPCIDSVCDEDARACQRVFLTDDRDNDGYRAPRPGSRPGDPDRCGDDCDDTNPRVHPGATEAATASTTTATGSSTTTQPSLPQGLRCG